MTKNDLEEHGCSGCCDHSGCSEEEGEDVYVFTDEDGNEKEFFLAESMEVGQREYALFLPLEEEDEDDPEAEESAVILRVEKDEKGNRTLVDLDSEEELNQVIASWEATMGEQEE